MSDATKRRRSSGVWRRQTAGQPSQPGNFRSRPPGFSAGKVPDDHARLVERSATERCYGCPHGIGYRDGVSTVFRVPGR
jgi:hypothetical protein